VPSTTSDLTARVNRTISGISSLQERVHPGIRRIVWLMFHAVGALFLILAFALSVFGRDIYVDQAFFLAFAKQWTLGRPLYTYLLEAHPPPAHFLHLIPTLISNITTLPPVVSFNLVASSLALFSGILVGLSSEKPRQFLIGSFWSTFALLSANDYIFGQREYFFMLAWIPYLLVRCGSGTPSLWTQAVAGAFAGFMVCIKPHFALVLAGSEAVIWALHRKRSRSTPFLALIVSGAIQVAIFFIFFDVRSYLEFIIRFNEGYYGRVGFHYRDVVDSLLTSIASRSSFVIAIFAAFLIPFRDRLRPFIDGAVASVAWGYILIILQGFFRPYYLPLLYLPAGAIALIMVAHGSEQMAAAYHGWRKLLYPLIVALSSCLVWFIMSDAGIVHSAYVRYRYGVQTQAFGGIKPDPVVDWVNTHVPPDSVMTVLGTYGLVYFDPLASMVRLGRPIFSHRPGAEEDFSDTTIYAAGAASPSAMIIQQDIENAKVEWLLIRRSMSSWGEFKSDDPVEWFRRSPLVWNWFSTTFVETDRFDQYSVYRRRLKQ
jgi:hypothetical protein